MPRSAILTLITGLLALLLLSGHAQAFDIEAARIIRGSWHVVFGDTLLVRGIGANMNYTWNVSNADKLLLLI